MLTLGFLFAYYAYAQSNNHVPPASHEEEAFNYQQNTLFNSPGIPNSDDWDKYELQQLQHQKRLPFDPCSCVSYAKYASGIDVGPIGLAKNHPVNADYPAVGGLVVFLGGRDGHLAVVTAIHVSSFRIKEYNNIPCKYSEREILFGSPNIKGFYN